MLPVRQARKNAANGNSQCGSVSYWGISSVGLEVIPESGLH
ncbi:hypothetical protein ABK675_23045 [Hafnia paralvei]